MLNRVLFLFIFSIVALSSSGQLQSSTLSNGMRVLIVNPPGTSSTSFNWIVKNGPFTESENMDGVSHLLSHSFFTANEAYQNSYDLERAIEEISCIPSVAIHDEFTSFKISTSNNYAQEAADILFKCASTTQVYEKHLNVLKEKTIQGVQTHLNEPTNKFDEEVMKYLWSKYYSRKNLYGSIEKIKALTATEINHHSNKYFSSNNSILIITTSLTENEVLSILSENFSKWPPTAYDPFVIHRIPQYRPLVSSSQLVIEREGDFPPYYQFSQLGPDPRIDKRSTYCAILLTSMLNLNSSKFKKNMSPKVDIIRANFDQRRYVSTFRIEFTPKEGELESSYQSFMKEMEKWKGNSYFTNDDLTKALQSIDESYKGSSYQDRELEIAHLWSVGGLNYYNSLIDSLKTIELNEIADFAANYLVGKHYVSALSISEGQRKELESDFFYANASDSVKHTEFTFKENDFRSRSKKFKIALIEIAQYLIINDHLSIQINGFADKSEYLKVKDDKLISFIEGNSAFIKVSSQIAESGHLRLDMARSIYIIKELNELGVSLNKLSGSASIFKGESKEEKSAVRKATVTLKKEFSNVAVF